MLYAHTYTINTSLGWHSLEMQIGEKLKSHKEYCTAHPDLHAAIP